MKGAVTLLVVSAVLGGPRANEILESMRRNLGRPAVRTPPASSGTQPTPASRAPAAPAARSVEPSDAAAIEQEIFALVNQARAAAGAPSLTYHTGLADAARAHSQELSTGAFFAHESPTTGSPRDRIERAGIRAYRTGENIADHYSVRGAHEMLMESPGHRKNILSRDYSHIGIGAVRRGGQIYLTQKFVSFR